jgi:hypothetical protein
MDVLNQSGGIDRVEICGGDTDSSFLHIKTEDFYEDIKPDLDEWLDTSNFEENNGFNFERVNEINSVNIKLIKNLLHLILFQQNL